MRVSDDGQDFMTGYGLTALLQLQHWDTRQDAVQYIDN